MDDAVQVPVVLIGPLPPPFGGVSVHISRLSQLLSRQGIRCLVLTRTPGTTSSETVVIKRGRWAFLWTLSKLGTRAGVLHDHTQHYQWKSPLLALATYAVMRFFSEKSILTIHDGTFNSHVQKVGRWRRSGIIRYLKLYRTILVINDELGETVSHLGIPRNRIRHVKTFLPYSGEPEPLPQDIEDFLSKHSPTWLVAGAFHPVYHYDIVARAFRSFLPRYPRAGLILISGGFTADEKFRSSVYDILQGSRNALLERQDLSSGILRTLYGRVDLLIRSAYPDGDGLSMREAIITETPVVATETGSRPEGIVQYDATDPEALCKSAERALSDRDSSRRRLLHEQSLALAHRNLDELTTLYREILHGRL